MESSPPRGGAPVTAGARADRLLEGRVAVITGAASGIGRAEVGLFAEEGALVVAVDIDPSVASDLPRGAALGVICDVASAAEVATAVERALTEFGRLDVLVNNAAVVVWGRVGDCSEADWDIAMKVNAKGTWLMCRQVLPAMVDQKQGVIINTASGVGLRPTEGLAAYSASKAAIICLTRSIAMEYGAHGIRANTICPGVIDTPMNDRVAMWRSDFLGQQAQSLLQNYPLRRMGGPQEIAEVAVFLASERASFLTGAAVPVDGGRTLH